MKFHFDLLAPIYNILIKQNFPYKVLNTLQFSEDRNDRILEVGGGTGRFIYSFRNKSKNLWMIDPSVQMLNKVKKTYGSKIKMKVGYAENIPFEDNSFDIVVVSDALHHWDNQEKGIKEVYRVLKPGGQLAIEEIHPNTNIGRFVVSMERTFVMHSRFFRPNELRDMLEKQGFKFVKWGAVRDPTYFVVMRKSNENIH